MAAGVRIEQDGAVQILRFDRPEKKNAITGAMYDALADALETASRDDGIGVSVVLGAPEVFTAGNDIGDFMRMVAQGGALGEPILRFLRAFAMHDRPLLAGVDGLAVGVGTTLLLHCDYVLATPRSVFSTPFTALGLVPEAASSLLAPRVMGHARAFELLVMGRDFDADRALAAGFVNAVVAPEALERQILAAARELAAKPREAVLASRRLLKGDPGEILARIDAEAALFAERLASAEAQKAFSAFMSKGKP
jgi:enoyl-CoA hydratase/carnithine racemase